jgi:murein DD-endopeptidase MepM/ murein hydrolase activator NlpD
MGVLVTNRRSAERGDSITVMVVPGGTGTIRRFQVPHAWLRRALWGAVGAALVLVAGAVDYALVRGRMGELARLRDETGEQREQIAAYVQRIEQISAELGELATFERKLRVIANLDSGDGVPLAGVGGVEGDALEPQRLSGLTRAQRHRRLLGSLDQLASNAGEQKQSLVALVSHLESQSARLSATPSIAPARGWITSDFGYRESPFTGRREFHRGLDIAAREGTPIVVPANGRVVFAGEDRALGRSVVVRHGYGIETTYGHLAQVDVKVGADVRRGDRVGLMGSTGRSTGPHLHYQIKVNDKPVDPQNYILD